MEQKKGWKGRNPVEDGRRRGQLNIEHHGLDHMKKLGEQGGKATVEAHGVGHMSELGKRGGAKTAQTCDMKTRAQMGGLKAGLARATDPEVIRKLQADIDALARGEAVAPRQRPRRKKPETSTEAAIV